MTVEKEAGPDEKAVRAAIDVYEDAVRTANPESFARVFHPDAKVVRPLVPGGPLIELPLSSYQGAAEVLYDGAVPVHETTKNVTLDVSGHVAVAHLDFSVTVGDEVFEGTDFINLAKLQGRWLVTYVLWDTWPVAGER